MKYDDDEKTSDITLLSMKQVLKVLGVSQTVYYRLVNSGELPTVSLGSRKLVRVKTLKKYLDSVETKKKVVHSGWFR